MLFMKSILWLMFVSTWNWTNKILLAYHFSSDIRHCFTNVYFDIIRLYNTFGMSVIINYFTVTFISIYFGLMCNLEKFTEDSLLSLTDTRINITSNTFMLCIPSWRVRSWLSKNLVILSTLVLYNLSKNKSFFKINLKGVFLFCTMSGYVRSWLSTSP